MINTIVLDIGNVLAHFGWKEYLRSCGYEEEIYQRLCKATVQHKRWKEWDRGNVDEADLIEQFCRQEPDLEKEIRDFFDHLVPMVKEYDYTNGFINQLKTNGYRVYLLSNYGRWHFENNSKDFSFLPYVDGGIISYTINHIKPEEQIYEALIKKYHINPSEAVFIDDATENIEGAKPFGFHTIQFINYEQALNELRALGIRI